MHGGSANDPSMDGKSAFHFGMTYVEQGETAQRLHLLTSSLGVDLPHRFSSTKDLVTNDIRRARPEDMTEAERREGLLYCMKVTFVESVSLMQASLTLVGWGVDP